MSGGSYIPKTGFSVTSSVYQPITRELTENVTFREQYSDEDLLAVEDDYLQAESAGDSLTPNLTRLSSPRG
jgi:hypothetical protein